MELFNAQSSNENGAVFKKNFCLSFWGSISIHRSYATSMSRWLIAWIKRAKLSTYCSLTIDKNGIVAIKEEKNLIELNGCSSVMSSKQTIKHPDTSAASNLSCSSSISSNDSVSHSVSTNNELELCRIPLHHVFEVIMPSDVERTCISLVVNQGINNPLLLQVFHHQDYLIVC